MEGLEISALNEHAKPARMVPTLEQFPARTSDLLRFADLDPQGHVNNTVFATFFETGRVMLLRAPGNELNWPGTTSVLAQLDIRFLREMHWPGTVEIGTATTRIGRSSYTFLQAIFHEGECAGTGLATMVMIDAATRKARALPPDVIARLERLRLREP
jgi:acyl-CoA thioester hydrolase